MLDAATVDASPGAAGPSGSSDSDADAGPAPADKIPDEEPAAPPERADDYAGWLAGQKARWRQGRHERKRRKLEAAERAKKSKGRAAAEAEEAAALAPAARGDVGRLLRQQERAAASAHWQLLQLADTATPGVFKAWLLADSKLFAVPLTVPRVFYVACDLPPDHPAAPRFPTSASVKLASRALPRGPDGAPPAAPFLYQVRG